MRNKFTGKIRPWLLSWTPPAGQSAKGKSVLVCEYKGKILMPFFVFFLKHIKNRRNWSTMCCRSRERRTRVREKTKPKSYRHYRMANAAGVCREEELAYYVWRTRKYVRCALSYVVVVTWANPNGRQLVIHRSGSACVSWVTNFLLETEMFCECWRCYSRIA